jgi:hypothetical protein
MPVTEQAETMIEDYPTEPTDYLPHIIARCLDKANRHKHRYRFRLGAAVVVVSPDQTYESVNEDVQAQWAAARANPPGGDSPVSPEEPSAPTAG